jgi:hypothetical protein
MSETPEVASSEMVQAIEAYAALCEQAYGMTVQDFAKESAKAQNLLLFVLLREMSAGVHYLTGQATLVEEKVREAMTPEGLAAIQGKVMGMLTGGMGSMFGGGF